MSFTGTCGATPDCLSGFGYYGSNVGNYSMWFAGGGSGHLALGSPTSGVYPLSMGGNTIDFTFSYGTSFLDGTITLFDVTDGSNAPRSSVAWTSPAAISLGSSTVDTRIWISTPTWETIRGSTRSSRDKRIPPRALSRLENWCRPQLRNPVAWRCLAPESWDSRVYYAAN